ncbi:hypothetical protein Tco_1168275 [Tanacetum coccineum]
MSSPNRSTSDIEDALSSMNIHNYTSASSATSGSTSFNSSEDSRNCMIQPVFSSFYNNPYLKDVQAFYAKELPISSPDPITPPTILTPSPVSPPSLLFDPRYFFVPEELLPPKKRICSPSSSSTTLPNPSRNQTRNLVSPSLSVYTPTPPQIFDISFMDPNRYPVVTSLIHIESRKSPTAVLFDDDTGRISIVIVNTIEYHLVFWQISQCSVLKWNVSPYEFL